MPPSRDAAFLASIAAGLHAQPDELQTVRGIVEAACEVLPEAHHASVTVPARRGSFATLAATSPLAEQVDALQLALDEGPCVEAAAEAGWVRSGDTGRDARWPDWGRGSADLGVHSALALALVVGDERVGVLSLYAEERGRFNDREALELAELYAVHAATALASARLAAGLESAMVSRHRIGLAQGILVERYAMDVDGAFAFLQRISSTQNRKLREVADELVATGQVEGVDLGSVD